MSDSEETISVCSDDANYILSENSDYFEERCENKCTSDTVLYEIEGEVDARFADASPDVRADILRMYYVMVDNAQVSTRSNTKEIDDMRAHYDKLVASLREQLRVAMDTNSNDRFQDALKEKMDTLTDMIETMRRDGEPTVYANNTDKGDAGENMILSVLETIPGTHVTNTSNKAMCADMWCNYANCDIMIESKHVKSVKNNEVVKFHRDIEMNTAIDGAIFISISEGVRIPHRRKYFDFDMLDGRVPCVYLSDFEVNSQTLFLALQLIKLYKQRDGDNEVVIKLKEAFIGIMKEFEVEMDTIRKMKKTAKGFLTDLVKMDDCLRRSLNRMTETLNSVNHGENEHKYAPNNGNSSDSNTSGDNTSEHSNHHQEDNWVQPQQYKPVIERRVNTSRKKISSK